MPAIKPTLSKTFSTALTAAKKDGKVTDAEATRLIKLAAGSLKQSSQPMIDQKAYLSEFKALGSRRLAASDALGNADFLVNSAATLRVSELAVKALNKDLKALGARTPPALKGIELRVGDLGDSAGVIVSRGGKDVGANDASLKLLQSLIKKHPELKGTDFLNLYSQ